MLFRSNPQFEDEQAVNPFDMWKGANFKLKIRKVDGYQNYDKSEFDSSSALAADDELEKIWKSEHSLKELLGDKEFKSYEKLKERLDKVLGLVGDTPVARTTVEQAKAKPKFHEPEPDISGSDEDDMKYFESLASED